MMNLKNRLAAMLLALLLLTMPVLASADQTIAIDSPVFAVDDTLAMDLSGLAIYSTILSDTNNGILLTVAANDQIAAQAELIMDESGIVIAVNGMENAIIVSYESVAQLMDTALAAFSSAADNVLSEFGLDLESALSLFSVLESLDATTMFDEEAINTLMNDIMALDGCISEPYDDEFTEDENTVACQACEINITGEQIFTVLNDVWNVIRTSSIAQMDPTGTVSSLDIGELFGDIAGYFSVEGAVYNTETGNTYTRLYLLYPDFSGEDASASKAVALYVDSVATDTDYTLLISLSGDDFEEELNFEMTNAADRNFFSIYTTSNDELDGVFDLTVQQQFEANDEGNASALSATLTVNTAEILRFYTETNQTENTYSVYYQVGNNGEAVMECSVDTETDENGEVYGTAVTNFLIGEGSVASFGFNFGLLNGAVTEPFDVSGMNMIDIMDLVNMDEETEQKLTEDAMNALNNAIVALAEIPGIAQMFADAE